MRRILAFNADCDRKIRLEDEILYKERVENRQFDYAKCNQRLVILLMDFLRGSRIHFRDDYEIAIWLR